MTENVIYDVKGLIKDLNDLSPAFKKEMLKDYRKIAKKPNEKIKSAIPETAPLPGMRISKNPHGRLAWGAGKPANTTSIRFKTTGSRKYAITSLASIWVMSPMTAIADVAGKGSGVPRDEFTKPYPYRGGVRKHRVTSQGITMIQRLRLERKNNFVYPAVEKSLPDVEREIKLVLEQYAAKVNRKLG